ncbi:hypothetical protein FSP39_007370 [Pinctada imbricata]|uniref:Major facilitator superfamily (MFS) profile domain-containing protein n=1 Tax=Pinctada imbricata TaxID=66713 RepID=A0AA88XLE2_PINIB|nr:hypothetical protein FSP39_007370 [Pinctada imbricata]
MDLISTQSSLLCIFSSHRKNSKCQIQRKWVVLIAGFFSMFISASIPFNLSVLYVEFLREFGKSKAETALVQSVCSGTFLCAGFLSGSLVTRFGPRKCCIMGGLIAGIGISVSYFAMDIVFLVISIGAVAGFGLSMTYISTSSCVAQHFEGQSKLLALSFITFGSGLGSMTVPQAMDVMLRNFDWRGTLLVISAVCLNICVFGSVYVQPKPTDVNSNEKKTKQRRRSSISIQSNENESMKIQVGIIESFKTILGHKPFVFYILAIGAAISAYNAILVFFIDYYESKGFERETSLMLLLATNLSSSCFRFLPGLVLQSPRVPVLAIPCAALFLGTGTLALYPLADSLTHFIPVACMFGATLGCFVAAISLTTMEITGQKYFSTGVGVTMSMSGIMTAFSGPISGFLRDTTGSYDLCFFTSSGCLLVTFIFLSSVAVNGYIKDRKLEKELSLKDISSRRPARRHSSIFPWKKGVDIMNSVYSIS